MPTLGGECEVRCAAGSRRMGLLCPFCGERDSFRCAEDSDKGEEPLFTIETAKETVPTEFLEVFLSAVTT